MEERDNALARAAKDQARAQVPPSAVLSSSGRARSNPVAPFADAAGAVSVKEHVWERFARLSHALTQEWDYDQFTHTIAHEAAALFGATAAACWSLEATEASFTLMNTAGLDEPDKTPPARSQVPARISMTDSPLLQRVARSADVATLDIASPSPGGADLAVSRISAGGTVHTALAIPLSAHHRVLAILLVGFPAGDRLDAETLPQARLLGSVCGMALESLGLQSRLRETNGRLVSASLQAQQHADDLEAEKAQHEAFMGMIAHELGTPLTVIKMLSDKIVRGHAPESRWAAVGHSIRSQVARLQRLSEDLRDASRLATGNFTITCAEVDVAALVREVVNEQQLTTESHALAVQAPDVPVRGYWDQQRLVQAVGNLLSNAIKYSPAGGEVTVTITATPDVAEITVRDRGAGLSADDLVQLFQPYNRLFRVRGAQGSGLGLFITKGIVEAHGGTIVARSQGLGEGSAFIITLPIRAAQSAQPDSC